MRDKKREVAEAPSTDRHAAPDTYLTPREAAEVLGLSASTLAKWRCAGSGPTWVYFGGRVRYSHTALADFAAANIARSTSERRRSSAAK